MAIRPVDMQAVMPRALEGSRADAGQNTRQAAETQLFAQQVQKNVDTERQSVVQVNKSENPRVDKDGKNGGGAQYSANRQRRNNSGGQEQPGREKEKQSLLDISL